MLKNFNANTYKVLHAEVDRILKFYEWERDNGITLKQYLSEYFGTPINFIEPVFKRNGFYKDRKSGLAWMEIDDLAFTSKYMASQFDYELSVLNQKIHTTREIAAMRELVKMNSLSSKSMQEIRTALYNNENQQELRKIHTSTYLYFKKGV